VTNEYKVDMGCHNRTFNFRYMPEGSILVCVSVAHSERAGYGLKEIYVDFMPEPDPHNPNRTKPLDLKAETYRYGVCARCCTWSDEYGLVLTRGCNAQNNGCRRRAHASGPRPPSS
jgi:hypothetical protein